MARLVTKRYKKEAFFEFLSSRRRVWWQMFAALIMGALLMYPSPLIEKIKMMHLDDGQKRKLDQVTLALFYMGIYQSDGEL